MIFLPFMHYAEKRAKYFLKTLQCEYLKILKLCLVIFQHYEKFCVPTKSMILTSNMRLPPNRILDRTETHKNIDKE